MFLKNILGTTGFAVLAAAHVSMRTPCVRYTPFCDTCPELPPGQSLDQNINAPIGTHEYISQPLCKYTTPYGRPAAHWTAGSTVTVDFHPHAAVHGGGHCQFALSYDGGKTFVVIHDELKYCFTGGPSSSNSGTQLEYSIKLPANLPSSDRVVFAWAWNNAIGNREFYMNCADVSIQGGSGLGSYSGPEMLVANYGPNSPYIPEFNGNYETGLDLYSNRKMITVTGSGSSGNNTSAQSPASYAQSTVPNAPAPAPAPVPASVPSAQVPAAAPVPSSPPSSSAPPAVQNVPYLAGNSLNAPVHPTASYPAAPAPVSPSEHCTTMRV
ncbi:hypothetical protein GGI07_004610 [Coemansia sp. Benny D115]|nr:hypothetical protein GGI07_004610 [Coemansia sp. Benny D115]